MATRKFTGPEKVAIFLMALGEDTASKILSQMEDREIQTIGNYMSALGDVDMSGLDQITKEFYTAIESGSGGLGIPGLDFLRTTLMRSMDPVKATEILNNITTPVKTWVADWKRFACWSPK